MLRFARNQTKYDPHTSANARVIVPLLQGYEDAGDFTVGQRIKASIRGNFIFYSSVGVVGFVGVVVLIIMGRLKW